jgi:hypothetical protein
MVEKRIGEEETAFSRSVRAKIGELPQWREE